MERIVIIGCGGAGKSTLARQLGEKLRIPVVHLDKLFWKPGWVSISRDEFDVLHRDALSGERWIIDGNFASTMEMRLAACDTVFFLDYSLEVCLSGIADRRGKPRPDMPWIGLEEDEVFLAYIRNYNEESRPQVLELLAKYPDKQVIVFHDRAEASAFLENM